MGFPVAEFQGSAHLFVEEYDLLLPTISPSFCLGPLNMKGYR
jgi:hypothetical protein